MLLRAAIVMLVMLNLGAAGWWAFAPAPRATGGVLETQPQLRLLAAGEALPVERELPPPPPVAAASEPAASPAAAAPVCLSFGPFEAGRRDGALAALRARNVQGMARDVPAKGIRGWKVFLPALPTREAAQALAETLKASGVDDLFVMGQGSDANSIALGRFSSESGARKRQLELQRKGVQAQVAPVGGTPAQAWLDARLPAGTTAEAFADIAPSQPLDCNALN